MSKSSLRVLILIAITAVIGLLAWNKFKPSQSKELPAASSVPQTKPTVKIQVVQPEAFSEVISLSGSLTASEEVNLMSEAAGRITFLNLQEGSRVQKGEVLMRLNSDDLQAQLQRSEALLKELSSRDTRQKALLAKEAISQQEYDQFSAEMAVVKADLALVKAQIAKTEVRAPFSGRVGLRYVSLGAFVNQNSRIAELVNADPMYIDFSVPEKYASQIRTGMRLNFTVENLPDTFSADVKAIAPRIDANTRTLQVRAVTKNTKNELIAGAFAKVILKLNEIPDALLVSNTAVVPEMNAKKLFLIKDGVVKPVVITTSNRTANRVVVSTGLSAGDTVITAGVLKVRPGIAVEILEQP
ncbi:MAG: efflux RND transporter periplasmic adaptor subunit [Sphingobacteriaceae bacterium]|nr:efflux RND transporter periplasmic adaptor subunit [Sphingobacteriaceae bacterium]